MKKASVVLSLLMLLGLVAAPGVAQSPGGPDRIRRVRDPIFESYIVTLRSNETDVPQAARSLETEFGGKLSRVYTNAIKGFAIRLPESAAMRLAQSPRVALVEQDGIVRVSSAAQSAPPWGLDRSDQADLPLSGDYEYNATGAGVRAYIIDTGIRPSHTDFGGRASVGFDAFTDGQNGLDCNGHGTHVAGTIGGNVYGVAKNTSLIAVRVLDCSGSGSYSGVIAGVDWVTANRVLPAVANMSLGGGPSSSLDAAIRTSINSGVTYTLAAGNDSQDACNYSPARTLEAITVGATGIDDNKASFSNTGTCMDLFAPGVEITSASNGSDAATATLSGTSMSAPHVAGAAAMYLEKNPSALPSTVASALLNASTQGKVGSAGTGSPNRLLFSGFIGATPPPGGVAPPVANFSAACSSLTCTFTDTSTDSDGTIASRFWTFGDNTNSTAINPVKTYAAAGTFTVKLTVTDNGGATGFKEQQITVLTDPDTSVPNLTNGVARSDLSGAKGTFAYSKIYVPSGRGSLKIQLSATQSCLLSCNPNLDLYVRRSSKPSTGSYNCRARSTYSNEVCTISNPSAGWWYVGVRVASGTARINYSVTPTY